MDFVIRTSTGKSFSAQRTESILDAALRSKIALPYSCRTGRCNSCKARLIEGSTLPLHDELGLSLQERDAGHVLTCSRAANSDLLLEVEDLGDVELFTAKTIPCRVQALERLAEDVLHVSLRLPPNADFRFHPGQYIDVIGHGGVRRSYSVANAPAADKLLHLHVRKVPRGAMSRYWFEQAQPNDLLRLNGPLGTFFLREVRGIDVVFLATGTGIAPVKAMLEDLAARSPDQQPRSIAVYWGNRKVEDFYWHSRALDLPHRFAAVLSRPADAWEGWRGHVQSAALADRRDWSAAQVYACGSDAMIHDAKTALIQAGMNAQQFHADAFVCSAV